MATVTVEAGNFATLANDEEYSKRNDLLFGFYKEQSYDAITLGTQELNSPLSVWKQASEAGLPIVCANLFEGKRSKKPIFEPYKWYERDGVRIAVIGLLTERAYLKGACPDSANLRLKSPYEMKKLMRTVMKRSDYIAIIGDFMLQEAESLAAAYPETNLIVSSCAGVATFSKVGSTVIAPCGAKGYFGEYVETAVAPSDSVGYDKVRETLDTKIPADTLYERRVAESGIRPRK